MPSPLPDDASPGHEPYLRRLPADSPVRRDLITRGRDCLGWLALLVSLGICATAALPDGTPRRYSPGPVSFAHATWDDRCAACHQGVGIVQPADDRSCTTCHQGPPHSARQKAGDVPGCTECHREHQGRSASLKRVPDSQCTRCHANLASHVEGGGPRVGNVQGFDAGERHPTFRFERGKQADPGRLEFSHKRHLTPGMRLKPDSAPFTLGEVEKSAQDRYHLPGQADLSAPVELRCASCHSLEGQPVRAAGEYMAPVTYEQHCRACHPLTVERKAVELPHRLQPDKVRGWLEALYTSRLLEKPDLLPRPPTRPRPGRDPSVEEMAETARDRIHGQVARAQVELYASNKTCAKCHRLTPEIAGLPPGQFDKLRVDPTAVPQVWLTGARFDHAAHRALECRACHASAETAEKASEILLPGIKTCAECHAPADRAGRGGARHDCVECHRYHGGDHPLHGRGADIRGVPAERRLNATEFNHGRR